MKWKKRALATAFGGELPKAPDICPSIPCKHKRSVTESNTSLQTQAMPSPKKKMKSMRTTAKAETTARTSWARPPPSKKGRKFRLTDSERICRKRERNKKSNATRAAKKLEKKKKLETQGDESSDSD